MEWWLAMVQSLSRVRWFAAVVVCGAALELCARAGAQAPGEQAVAIQSGVEAQRPVARLSRLAGAVTVQAEDGTSAAADAALNMPLPAGTRLLAGDNGEAEVEFIDGSVLRVTSRSDVVIERLDPESQGTSLQLGNGLFYLELRASDSGSFTVGAGEVVMAPEVNASFRVRVQDAAVEVAALSGSVSVTRVNAYTAVLASGESLKTDPKNGKRYLLADVVPPESWDSWNERLAQAAQDEEASRTTVRDGYASQQAYGWADLDAHGNWYDVPGEGQVWQPTGYDAGFDPYGNGSWVYGSGGYAWASGYGWGWLPYRCGGWTFYQGFGWGWLPSPGCVSLGFGGGGFEGGYGGGFRIRHAPPGWRPPHRPGLTEGPVRHPTIPVHQPAQVAVAGPPTRRSGEPVRIAGVEASPLKHVGPQITPQGGSAVGSALMRDFPVRRGTHEPVIGLVSQGVVTRPGGSVEWHGHAGATGAAAGFGGNGANGRGDPLLRGQAAGDIPGVEGRVSRGNEAVGGVVVPRSSVPRVNGAPGPRLSAPAKGALPQAVPAVPRQAGPPVVPRPVAPVAMPHPVQLPPAVRVAPAAPMAAPAPHVSAAPSAPSAPAATHK